MVKKPCDFNKFGYCKFGDRCSLRPNNIICENVECIIQTREKRHPKECKYFEMYRRCKFLEFCRFKHTTDFPNDNLRKRVESLENTLAEVKISLEKSLKKNDYLENKLK